MVCRDVDVMYDDFYDHLVPDETQSVVDPRDVAVHSATSIDIL